MTVQGDRRRRAMDVAFYWFGLMVVLNLVILLFTLDHMAFRILSGVLVIAFAVAVGRSMLAKRLSP